MDTFTGSAGALTGHSPEIPSSITWLNQLGALLLDGSGAVVLTNSDGSQRSIVTIPGLGSTLAAGFSTRSTIDMGSIDNGSWTGSLCGGALTWVINNNGNGTQDVTLAVDTGFQLTNIPNVPGPHVLEVTYDGATGWALLLDGVQLLTDTVIWNPQDDTMAIQGNDSGSPSDLSMSSLEIAT